MGPIFFCLVRVTGVGKTKLGPPSLLDVLLCHLVTAGPKENGGDNPAWGTKPACSGLARGTKLPEGNVSLGKNSPAPAVSLSTPAQAGGD